VINQETARVIAAQGLTFINREEDLGTRGCAGPSSRITRSGWKRSTLDLAPLKLVASSGARNPRTLSGRDGRGAVGQPSRAGGHRDGSRTLIWACTSSRRSSAASSASSRPLAALRAQGQ